jgi:hypothetical protein
MSDGPKDPKGLTVIQQKLISLRNIGSEFSEHLMRFANSVERIEVIEFDNTNAGKEDLKKEITFEEMSIQQKMIYLDNVYRENLRIFCFLLGKLDERI